MMFFQNASDNVYGLVLSDMLTKGYNEEVLNFGPMMLSYALIAALLIWYGPELSKKYSTSLPTFNIWFNLAYLYACLYFLVCNISHLFIRPVLYLSLFQMVMAALLLHYLWNEYKVYGRKRVMTLFFCCVLAANTVWDVYKAVDSGRKWEATSYKFYFMNMDEVRYRGLN
jgi:hypothetical protein